MTLQKFLLSAMKSRIFWTRFLKYIFLQSYFLVVYCDGQNSEIIETKKLFLGSHHSLTILALNEESIYNELKDAHGLTQFPASLEWYLDDYRDSCRLVRKTRHVNSNESGPNIIAGHPLLAYRMLYRYVVHLRPIFRDFKDVPKLNATLESYLRRIEESIGWPDRSNVEKAMTGILRLQHVYDLNITEFVSGITFDLESPMEFVQAIHCYELGNFAIRERHFALAVEWFELAKFILENGDDETIDLDTIKNSLAEAINTHDEEWDRTENYVPEFFTWKLSTLANNTKLVREKRRTYQSAYWRGKRENNFNTINFWGLCSGIDMRTEEEKSDLFCWYDSTSNPAWRINPLKIEQLGKTPVVLQIYDVVQDGLIQKLINESQPALIKSQVFSGTNENDNRQESPVRTSLNTWLNDGEIPELRTLPRRIELITGLVALPESSSEMIQVATYSFSGHYEIHQDAFKDSSEPYWSTKGERMATFMIYAGIAAKPVKGSAVFWYNTKLNCVADENTWHGACPVILGSKWVANKWIRANDQFLRRPCSLNPEN